MITIFQQVHNGDGICDPMKYVKRYGREIEEAGQLFAYLNLAEYDSKSYLGWRPTRRLIEILAKQAAHPSKLGKKAGESSLILDLLADAVFGESNIYDPGNPGLLGYNILHALGLIRENDGGNRVATPLLQQLFAIGYYNKPHEG